MSRFIVVVTGHSKLDSGGVGTHLRLLIGGLKGNFEGVQVVLGGGFISRLFNSVVRVFCKLFRMSHLYESIHPIANILFIQRALAEKLHVLGAENEFIVHAHDRSSAIAAYRLKDRFKIKVIQTLHAPFYQQYLIHPNFKDSLVPLYIKALDEVSVCYVDSFIAVDCLQKELLLRDFGLNVSSDDIHIIPNAVEERLLNYCGGARDKYFVVARHLHEKNGVEYALRAFALFLQRTKSFEYKIVVLGQGPLKESLIELIRELNLTQHVKMLGAVPRVKAIEIISKAAASIVPSVPVGDYVEATSLTMLESMAMGVPLIASNIGGIKDVLDGNDAAFLVSPRDVEGIAKAMISVYREDSVVLSQVANSIELVRNEYVASKWIEKTCSVYHD